VSLLRQFWRVCGGGSVGVRAETFRQRQLEQLRRWPWERLAGLAPGQVDESEPDRMITLHAEDDVVTSLAAGDCRDGLAV
jgi:hypothetical protein